MPTDSHLLQPPWLNAQSPREGRYVVGPLLGRGGMGDVHEAWDVVLCRTVALKVLKEIEPAALIRFMHEAQIHARVVHPNICRIYDVDNHEGSLRVAMQLVRGANLEQVRGELSVREVVAILALVAQAVHVVHRLNLVHRDLKPSNILLERGAEGEWIPYVCDFGLAMALDEPALTLTHAVIGTPAYMAPEQLHGGRDRISAATDIYALGGTLHYALSGHPPGIAGTKHSPSGNSDIPRDLRAIIRKCLRSEPEQRYPSASALAEDLWRFQQGLPVRAAAGTRSLLAAGRRALRLVRPWLLPLASTALVGLGWTVQRVQARTRELRHLAWAQRSVLEATSMVQEFHQEMMLPIHDLRPSYARMRTRMEMERLRMQDMAPGYRSSSHFALGSASFLLGDYEAAKADLEQAWTGGFREPALAAMLTLAQRAVAHSAEEAGQFAQDSAGPASSPGIDLRPVLKEAPDPAAGALLAYLDQDYLKGAAGSHAIFVAAPWRWQAAALEATNLLALARQELDAGSPAKAAAHSQQALAAAQNALAVGQSDPLLYHIYFQAARAVAAHHLESGELPRSFLADLEASADRALRLDPGNPDLQEDWVALRVLQARCLALAGQDPEPELSAARTFLATWALEPLTVRLSSQRMLVFWMLAERAFVRGEDPGPALTEAMKTSGHTPFLGRDYLWEVLNFKARVDAARGIDPRPVLDAALERMQPLHPGLPWSLKETFADSWLIHAEWEASHHLDPAPSIRNALALAESARSQNPGSGSARALEGRALVLEMRTAPQERGRLLALAQERLKEALALTPRGAQQNLLKRALQGLPR